MELCLQGLHYSPEVNTHILANCLASLGISELLKIKHSLDTMDREDEEERKKLKNLENAKKQDKVLCKEDENGKCSSPSSMALTADDRGSYAHSHAPSTSYHTHTVSWHPVEEKPTKLETIFQISITALSFLSFGGYLLCLIIHSLKNKGKSFIHRVTTTAAPATNVKKIKVYRRSRRSSLPPMPATESYYYANNPYQFYVNNRKLNV